MVQDRTNCLALSWKNWTYKYSQDKASQLSRFNSWAVTELLM